MELRDYQRSKVYRAETEFKRDCLQSARDDIRLDTVSEMQDFVNSTVGSDWFWKRWKINYISVSDGRGRRRAAAYYRDKRIAMPRWCRDKLIVLHEIAHICIHHGTHYAPEQQHRNFNKRYMASHGQEFCKAFLALVDYVFGREMEETLRSYFADIGVRYMGSDYDWEMQRKENYQKNRERTWAKFQKGMVNV